MSQANTTSDVEPAVAERRRRLGVLSCGFLIDQANIGVGQLGSIDTLLVLAINQANIAPLTREAAARSAYGGLGAPAPDDERRPVSISAVAHSLGLPFETTRRHIKGLEAAGVCITSTRGVIVPAAFLQSDGYIETVVNGHGRLKAFFQAAMRAGLIDALPPSAFPAEGNEPIRAAARLRSDYALRSAEVLMQLVGDVIAALVYLGVLDGVGRPISIAALSRRLGVPEETVRRRTTQLTDAGVCERTSQGLLITAPMLKSDPAEAFFTANAINAQRLFAALAERGVIDAWS
jgi:predicted transcriptional regulator